MRNWAAWSRFILEHERVSFAWGAEGIDCVRFAAGAIRALTGNDPMAELPGWRSAGGARMQIARIGKGGGLGACVDLPLTPAALAHAHRGDIAAIEHGELGLMLMVIEGPSLVGPGEHGLRRASRGAMVQAWSAG